MNLHEIQKEIYENKKKRGFNISDIGKEIVLLTEELGEFARAFRDENKEGMADAIGDIIVYCLGLCEILGINSEELIKRIVEVNKTRSHRSDFKEK